MSIFTATTIPELLVQNLPRDLVMGVEDGLLAGASRGFEAAKNMHKGHWRSALGQMRHFHMNEAYAEALEATGAAPSPLRGNAVVVGRAGVVALSRFNVSDGVWNNARRSSIRKLLATSNILVEPLVQPHLFEQLQPVSEMTAFFVACFSTASPEAPLRIDIAVPDSRLENWLHREPLSNFLSRYDVAPVQVDTAIPKLKIGAAKKDSD